jgi:outer membrane biogenesis lipoprotein LolB
MTMKMKFISSVIAALLLTSCVSKSSQRESETHQNNSALYDPPTLTLVKGKTYQFKEGEIEGRGQKFHSHYSYIMALITGKPYEQE